MTVRISFKHIGAVVLLGIFFAFSLESVSGQTPIPGNRRDPLSPAEQARLLGQTNPFDKGEKPDSMAKRPAKVRKPLESYFFNDSIRSESLFAWNLNLYRNNTAMLEIDTLINRFEVDYPFLRNDVGSAYLGNLGSATVPLNYVLRPQYKNFTFVQAYDAYLMTPSRVRFFNVKRPFSHLSYYFSGQTQKAEEQLRVTHAQNISPSSGFNFDYKNRGTKGMYAHQRSKDKNLSFAFAHTGKKYTIHAAYLYNMGNINENGGVLRDRDITDTVFDGPENVEVKLNNAKNMFKSNGFFIVQSYGMPLRKLTDQDFSIANQSTIFVGHAIEYTKFKKIYTDKKSESGDYYQHWYIDPSSTRDSISERLLDNRLFVQLQPWDREGIVGTIDAGVGVSMHKYYLFSLDQYLVPGKGITKNSVYVYGSIQGKFRKYLNWNSGLHYIPVGYRAQDITFTASIDLSAYLKQRPITFSASFFFDRRTPSYWAENYFSNHFVWRNSFSKETETRIDAKLDIPSIGLEAAVWQSITTNKIYYGPDCLPQQAGGSVSVSGVYLRKDFLLGGFHLNHRVLLQWSSNQEVVPVPMMSAFASYFFEFNVVKNVLRMQLGLDGSYNTSYYAFGYNPAIAQFYNQREKKLGDYPLVDFFVAAKWKRMRILAKMQHLNQDLFGDNNYFTVLHYPLNRRMFKLGISWTFYD